ncbi:hypothetical protein CDD83_8957 [Cordyceps sp. RAO-2017]|nr:hypothetical protein CDD83_8957 [Cordyceps sp. RAO-2017]
MLKLTRLSLRTPRPQSLLGIVSLQTGTELVAMALVFNKATGVYGLLAILTGYQLSLLQLSTYVYSILVLSVLVYLIPHIRRQSPCECLALAWVYLLDTFINGLYTALFGLDLYFAGIAADGTDSASAASLPNVVAKELGGFTQETQTSSAPVSQETVTSVLLIVGLTLIRVYFSIVVMSYARQVLQRHMQLLAVEGPVVDEQQGPFAAGLPCGDGRRGWMGRFMVRYGRRYWLEVDEADYWKRNPHSKPSARDTFDGEN